MRSPAGARPPRWPGPAATLLVLLVLAGVLRVWAARRAGNALFPALTVLAFLQAMALILNLLPIPGLDGFNAIRPFLPASLTRTYRAEALAMLGLLLVLFWSRAPAASCSARRRRRRRLGLIPMPCSTAGGPSASGASRGPGRRAPRPGPPPHRGP